MKAIERELTEGAEWSSGFFEKLALVDAATGHAVDEMLTLIRVARRSKAPRKL